MHMGEKTRQRVEEAMLSPEYDRNVRLMDLRDIYQLDQPLKITYGKLSAESAIRVLYELGFASIVAKFHEWFAVYEGASHADVSD
jgi:hypothetical protein